MADRYVIDRYGPYWRVTDTHTGEAFLHLSEDAARLAAHPDITTGVIADQPANQ